MKRMRYHYCDDGHCRVKRQCALPKRVFIATMLQ